MRVFFLRQVNRVTQVEFLQFSKAIPIHQRKESSRDTGSQAKPRNVHRSARRKIQGNDDNLYSLTLSNNRNSDPKHNHNSDLVIEQLLPSRTSTTATNDRVPGKRMTAWQDSHHQDQTINPPSPSVAPVQQKDHDDEDLRLARQAATKAIRAQDTDLSTALKDSNIQAKEEYKDTKVHEKEGHSPSESGEDHPKVSNENHPTLSRHVRLDHITRLPQ